MNKAIVKAVVAAGMIAAMGTTHAEDGDLGIGVGASYSTLGAGVAIGKSFTDYFSVRLGLNSSSESADDTIDGIQYDAEMDFSSTALILDWHPLGGSFHVSAGYLNSDNELTGSATPSGDVNIGDYPTQTVTAGDLVLDAGVKLGSGPYVGLGWGNVPAKGFGFVFEVGVVDMGAPEVSLSLDRSSNTTLRDNIIASGDVAKEEANMQADLDEFDTYPVIALGISYGF